MAGTLHAISVLKEVWREASETPNCILTIDAVIGAELAAVIRSIRINRRTDVAAVTAVAAAAAKGTGQTRALRRVVSLVYR
jgi:hypothetical protein